MEYETPDLLVRVQDHVTMVRIKTANLTSMGDISRLSASLEGLVRDGTLRLIVDFKLVRHVGSAALGTLIALQKNMKDRGGRLVLSHPEHIQELLQVSQTARLFEIAPDSKAALKLLKPD